MERFVQRLKRVDAYPKTMDDLSIKTVAGGFMTVFSIIIIGLLIISEWRDYRHLNIKTELQVDVLRREKLKINFNVTLPHMPCFLLSVDTMDAAGTSQNDVVQYIEKMQIDNQGRWLGLYNDTEEEEHIKRKEENNEKEDSENKIDNLSKCGNCYGAENKPNQCCNTCEEVMEAYRQKGWQLMQLEKIEQCKGSKFWRKRFEEKKDDGCQVTGKILVNKVAGNVHIAPGKSLQHDYLHLHDLFGFGNIEGNLAHRISRLSFGEDIPTMNYPLDGYSLNSTVKTTMFQYFIKVVPTKYTYLNGTTVWTNQFSVTQHERLVKPGMGGLPGVFFNFDIAPMMVIYTEYRRSFTQFLTGICAIVGGMIAVAGMMDGFIYHTERSIRKKLDIGKQW